jgi:hypothetical protein
MSRFGLFAFVGFVACLSLSCNERQNTTVSVGHDFKSVGNGKVTAVLEAEHETIKLNGELELMYGEFVVWLANPDGDTVYNRSFQAVFNKKWDTTFTSMPGEWELSYQIRKLEDLNPSGTFRFSLIY